MTVSQPQPLPAAPNLFCAGKVHEDRMAPAILDPMARAGPTRVGLIEDGVMFCASCVHELNRGGGEPR